MMGAIRWHDFDNAQSPIVPRLRNQTEEAVAECKTNECKCIPLLLQGRQTNTRIYKRIDIYMRA